MGTEDDDSFSDDSLEFSKKRVRQQRQKFRTSRKGQTYLKLYQQRLAVEFIQLNKCKQFNDSQCYPSRSATPPNSDRESKLEVEKSDSQPGKKAKSSNLWSKFISEKKKLRETKSETDTKLEMFRKRLAYGQLTSSLNRFNIKCTEKIKKKRNKSGTVPAGKILSPVESCDAPSDICPGLLDESHHLEKIQTKLQLMKVRHQKDKKIVDQIRQSLKAECL